MRPTWKLTKVQRQPTSATSWPAERSGLCRLVAQGREGEKEGRFAIESDCVRSHHRSSRGD